MRIALYHNLMSGGAKRALFETARRLAERHEIDVFTLSSADHAFCDLRPFVARYRTFDFETLPLLASPFGALNHGVRWADIVRLRSVQQLIAAQIDAGEYDVAFVHSSDRLTNGPMLLQHLHTPAVCYCNDPLRARYDPPIKRPYAELHGVRSAIDKMNGLRWLYQTQVGYEDRKSLRAASQVLVNSCFSRETIYRIYGIQAHVCFLGIDTQVFYPKAVERGDYVLSVGTVNPIKGHDFIIRSLARVPERIRPLLIVVGNFSVADEQVFLFNLAHNLNVNIEFRVMVTADDLVDLYNRASMTVYAPILEPFGFVPLESMACGTPVVGVAEGGVRETVQHGITGFLTDRDPEQFAQTIQLLLANPELANEIGAKGPGYVQARWNWEDSVARIEAALFKAVEDRRKVS